MGLDARSGRVRIPFVDSRPIGAALHLLAIINNILDISKIESGKLRLGKTTFDMGKAFDSVCAVVAQRAHAKGLERVLDVASRANIAGF